MESVKPKKAHRQPQAGRGAEKKIARDRKKKGAPLKVKGRNLKAFTYSSHVAAQRARKRNADRAYKSMHAPLVNRTTVEPPPFLVAIVGPAGVGKSNLIKSLVKHYTKHSLHATPGPITVVASKTKRLTFLECPNDLNCMIDVVSTIIQCCSLLSFCLSCVRL